MTTGDKYCHSYHLKCSYKNRFLICALVLFFNNIHVAKDLALAILSPEQIIKVNWCPMHVNLPRTWSDIIVHMQTEKHGSTMHAVISF